MKTDKSDIELVADFDSLQCETQSNGVRYYTYTDPVSKETWGYEPSDLLYEVSWDWLMPVVEKIRSLRDESLTDKTNGLAYSSITIGFEANGHEYGASERKFRAYLLGSLHYQRMINSFQHTYDKIDVPHFTEYGSDSITTLYKVIISFIKWYNYNTPKQ